MKINFIYSENVFYAPIIIEKFLIIIILLCIYLCNMFWKNLFIKHIKKSTKSLKIIKSHKEYILLELLFIIFISNIYFK